MDYLVLVPVRADRIDDNDNVFESEVKAAVIEAVAGELNYGDQVGFTHHLDGRVTLAVDGGRIAAVPGNTAVRVVDVCRTALNTFRAGEKPTRQLVDLMEGLIRDFGGPVDLAAPPVRGDNPPGASMGAKMAKLMRHCLQIKAADTVEGFERWYFSQSDEDLFAILRCEDAIATDYGIGNLHKSFQPTESLGEVAEMLENGSVCL